MNIYVIIFERSSDPFNAEVRAFATEKLAKEALKKHAEDFIKVYPNCSKDIWDSFYENGENAYAFQPYEDDDFYARIEKVDLEDEDNLCPFCNGHGKVHVNPEGFYMECEKCGCKTKFYKEKWECIEAWNRRG